MIPMLYRTSNFHETDMKVLLLIGLNRYIYLMGVRQENLPFKRH